MSIQEINDLINQTINPLGGEPKVKGSALNKLLKILAAEGNAAGGPADTSKLAKLDQANTFAGSLTAPAFIGDGSKLTNLPLGTGGGTATPHNFSVVTATNVVGYDTYLDAVNLGQAGITANVAAYTTQDTDLYPRLIGRVLTGNNVQVNAKDTSVRWSFGDATVVRDVTFGSASGPKGTLYVYQDYTINSVLFDNVRSYWNLEVSSGDSDCALIVKGGSYIDHLASGGVIHLYDSSILNSASGAGYVCLYDNASVGDGVTCPVIDMRGSTTRGALAAKADLVNGKVFADQLPLAHNGASPVVLDSSGNFNLALDGYTLGFDYETSQMYVTKTQAIFDTPTGTDTYTLPTVQAVRDYVLGKPKADLVNGSVPLAQLPYPGYTPPNIKTAVVNTPAAAWAAGELLDSYYQALPAGSKPGMKFIGSSLAGAACVYECMNASRDYEGAAMTPVYTWVRWSR